jgi:hypothetical protein
VSPEFKVAVFVLLGITILCGGLAVGFSVGFAHPTPSQSSAEHWLYGLAGSAFSGMLGLFGGRAA